MKTSQILIITAAVCGLSLSALCDDQTVQTTTTTQSSGTINEFSPDTIVIRSESAPEPVRYSYSKTTTYVDETGAPVSIETVKSGLPVTVEYARIGDRLVARRVIVRRAVVTTPAAPVIEKKTTTTDDDDGKEIIYRSHQEMQGDALHLPRSAASLSLPTVNMKMKLILAFILGAMALGILPGCESEHRTTTTTTTTEETVPPPAAAATTEPRTVRTY